MPPEPMDPFERFPVQPDDPMRAFYGVSLSWVAKPAVIVATIVLVAMLVWPGSRRAETVGPFDAPRIQQVGREEF